ncbi:MAG: diaminopimelate decarboxylase [Clostridia bacterium]|nr:diaminopimelate decarboxylase [Clostridia bacterium]
MEMIQNETNEGVLTVGGAEVPALAREFGTPLFIMDRGLIEENMRAYKSAIDEAYDGRGLVLYASKAFSAKEIYRIANKEGLGVDVVSGGELYTALSAGFPAENICMHGNNKSIEEILFAIENGVGRIVADGEEELEILDKLFEGREKLPRVLVRIRPGIEAHTHDFIQTGQEDSKFGVSLSDGEALRVLCKPYKNYKITGVHCHIGSQIFEDKPFMTAADLMVKLLSDVYKESGHLLEEVNLGGGFGIRYTDKDTPRPYHDAMLATIAAVKKAAERYGIPYPFLLVEPGRSIVGEAGVTVYTVGAIKDIPDIRKYVSVDGGMGDNPRYILYGAEYDAVLPEKTKAPREEVVTICGRCCESGDILIKDICMPKVQRGDLLAVLSTGAYNYSMSSNYNRLPRPAVVMVKDGEAKLCVRRESYEDIIRNDI